MRLMLTHACTARAPATLLLAFGVLAACDDPRRSGPVALPGAAQTIAYEDSVRNGLIRAHATTPATTNPAEALIAADPGVSIVSLTPSNHQGYDQPQTIVGVTSGPVVKVTVVGSGAIFCSGSYGSLIGYDSSGTVLGQTPLTLIDPSDCSPPENPDNVTFGAAATLEIATGTIARFEITPMSPLTGPVFDWHTGGFLDGNFYQNYGVGVEAGKVRCVTGDTLVDKPAVYDFLTQMREQSGALQSDTTKKKESVWVMRDNGTGPRFEPVPGAIGIRCYVLNFSFTNLPYGPGSEDVRAILHAHTWRDGDVQQCEGAAVDGLQYSPLQQFGGSPADWVQFFGYNLLLNNPDNGTTQPHQVNWYVIDGSYLHRMEPGAPLRGDKNHHSFTQLSETGTCTFRRTQP